MAAKKRKVERETKEYVEPIFDMDRESMADFYEEVGGFDENGVGGNWDCDEDD